MGNDGDVQSGSEVAFKIICLLKLPGTHQVQENSFITVQFATMSRCVGNGNKSMMSRNMVTTSSWAGQISYSRL